MAFCLFVLVTRPGTVQEVYHNTCFHCGPRDRPLGTLRVVTARELDVPSGSFTSHSFKVSEAALPLAQVINFA